MAQFSHLTEIITTVPAILFWIFYALSSGLLLILAITDSTYYIIHKERWLQQFNYWYHWLTLFLKLTLANGIVLAAVLAFNWAGFWGKAPFITSPVSVGSEIFIMAVASILLYFLSKKRNSFTPKHYLAVVWTSGIFFNLALWWPVAVSAWAECPLGTYVIASDMTLAISHPSWVIASPLAALKFFHMVTSCWVIGATFVISTCCLHILRQKQGLEQYQTSIFIGLTAAFLGLILTMCIGDSTGYTVAKQQPMKMAAIQDIEKGGKEMPFTVIAPVKFSNLLSRLSTHSNFGFVPGKEDVISGGYALPEGGIAKSFQQKHDLAIQSLQTRKNISNNRQEQQFRYESQYSGYAHLDNAAQVRPTSKIHFWAFRIMIGAGFLLMLLIGALIYLFINKNSTWNKRILMLNIFACPLAIICTVCGWIIAEFGKFPWAITEFLPVSEAISQYSPTTLYIELAVIVILHTISISIIVRNNKITQL